MFGLFDPTLYNEWDYLSMMGLQLTDYSKRDHLLQNSMLLNKTSKHGGWYIHVNQQIIYQKIDVK